MDGEDDPHVVANMMNSHFAKAGEVLSERLPDPNFENLENNANEDGGPNWYKFGLEPVMRDVSLLVQNLKPSKIYGLTARLLIDFGEVIVVPLYNVHHKLVNY